MRKILSTLPTDMTYSIEPSTLYSWFHQLQFREIWLTPEEQALIDPTGRGRAHVSALRDGKPTPIPRVFEQLTPDEWLSKYDTLMRKQKFSPVAKPYLDYNREMYSKFGWQGAKFSVYQLKKMFMPFYENAHHPHDVERLSVGRDFLIRRIRAIVKAKGLPPYEDKIQGTTGTCGGLPSMQKKGSFVAESEGREFIQIPLFDLPGERNMRGKPRAINMDATVNVRYIENVILHIQTWLKTNLPEYFSAWRNPREVLQPMIHTSLQKHDRFFGFDYEHCDEHFSWDVAREVVMPIIKELTTPNEFQTVDRFMAMLFTQPLYWGSVAWVGLHNLFSGQIITNFLETIFGVVLLLSAALILRIDNHHYWLSVLGDDLILVVSRKEAAIFDQVIDVVTGLSNAADMVMNKEKCSATDYCKYLRRTYYLGQTVLMNEAGQTYVQGAYPSVLTIMQIIFPEYHMAIEDSNFFVAVCQRLDNLEGSPEFKVICEFIFSKLDGVLEYDTTAPVSYTDWWYRLYGECWHPESSPSFKIWRTRKMLRANSH